MESLNLTEKDGAYAEFQKWREAMGTQLSAIAEQASEEEKAQIESFIKNFKYDADAQAPALMSEEEDETELVERFSTARSLLLTDCIELLNGIKTADVSEYRTALKKELEAVS